MKNIIKITEFTPVSEIQFLNEGEMLSVRGGIEPLKPKSRPKEYYDDENDG
jgi:hypothetical protein